MQCSLCRSVCQGLLHAGEASRKVQSSPCPDLFNMSLDFTLDSQDEEIPSNLALKMLNLLIPSRTLYYTTNCFWSSSGPGMRAHSAGKKRRKKRSHRRLEEASMELCWKGTSMHFKWIQPDQTKPPLSQLIIYACLQARLEIVGVPSPLRSLDHLFPVHSEGPHCFANHLSGLR